MIVYIVLAIIVIIVLFKINNNDSVDKSDEYNTYSDKSIKNQDINNELDKDIIEQKDNLIKNEPCNEEKYELDTKQIDNSIIQELFNATIVRENIRKIENTKELETFHNEITKMNYSYSLNIIKEDPVVKLINEYLLFEDTYNEIYDNVINYHNTLMWERNKKNTKEKHIPSENLILITWSCFNNYQKQNVEDLIYRIKEEMKNREGYKLIIEIDIHGANLNELDELLKPLVECLGRYYVKLTLIHGYKRGTVLKDYIREYNHPNINYKEFPRDNMGRTIYNIGYKNITDISFRNEGKSKEANIDEELNEITREEKAALNKKDVEKLFIELYPGLHKKKLELEKSLEFYGLSEDSVEMYSCIKGEFERTYNRINKKTRIDINRRINLKNKVSNNDDDYDYDIPDYVDAMFYDFYFSENIELFIYMTDNNEMVRSRYTAYHKIESYITAKREDRLRIEKMIRSKEIKKYKENYEIEKANRYKQLESLIDNFPNIRIGSIIYHSTRGMLKVVEITDNQIITMDEDNTERCFMKDPKILKYIVNIKF